MNHIRRRSNTVADWQASIPDEAFDADIGDLAEEQDDDDDTEVAAPHDSDNSPVVFATRAILRGEINGTLLKYLPPLKEITFVPSPQTGYVNIQIILGQKDGRPLHAVFKSSANKKVSPSFSVLVCGAKLAYQLFGDGWTKLDFGELTRVIGDWPSDLVWPFSAACNVQELKALCKWYFTLAADAGVHGFKEHLFPVNETLITHLTKACERVRASLAGDNLDLSSDDGDDEADSPSSEPRATGISDDVSVTSGSVGKPSADSFADFVSHFSAVQSSAPTTPVAGPSIGQNQSMFKRGRKPQEVRKHPARRPITLNPPRAPRKQSSVHSQSPIPASRGMAKSALRGYVVGDPVTMKHTMIARLNEELQRETQRISESRRKRKEIKACLKKLEEDPRAGKTSRGQTGRRHGREHVARANNTNSEDVAPAEDWVM
jgi:hypothetical protein